MAPDRGTRVELNQCLFGYDGGHRLLAASQRLPEETASLLLLHTDLALGLPSSSFESYWTGLPLTPLKAYALMRTWPAPEMPRPGCVWTHVLLIGFADMARFTDLAILRDHFVRPSRPDAFSTYKEPVIAGEVAREILDRPVGSTCEGFLVLRALYAADTKGVLRADEGDFDDLIFAAWSQQWPRLRRSFSFRTARVAGEPGGPRSRFDLRLARNPSLASAQGSAGAEGLVEPWECAALDDLLHGPSGFRHFLWRYGSDQRRGRERFRFLAEIYASTREPELSGDALSRVLEQAIEVLPDPRDGKLLKEDLVSAGQSRYSLLPASDPVDILDFFASGADRGALPPPPTVAFRAVHDLWSDQPARILTIAERAVSRGSVVADQVLQRLAGVAVPETFLALSNEHPIVRARLVEADPTLLDSPGLAGVGQPERSELLRLVTEPDLASRIVGRLITSDDVEAASQLMDRFPDVVDGRVLEALTEWIAGRGPAVPRSWLEAVRSYSPASLARRLLGRVTTTSALAACAILLQLDLRTGLGANTTVWAEAMARAHDDVGGDTRQKLLAYLMSLALAQPTRGCEPLFERSFEPIHSDLRSSRVPQDALDTLVEVLPDLLWWEQWDTCHRLRLGTVNAYVNADLDPKSFGRLTRDSSLFKRLAQLAAGSKQGRRFLKNVIA